MIVRYTMESSSYGKTINVTEERYFEYFVKNDGVYYLVIGGDNYSAKHSYKEIVTSIGPMKLPLGIARHMKLMVSSYAWKEAIIMPDDFIWKPKFPIQQRT